MKRIWFGIVFLSAMAPIRAQDSLAYKERLDRVVEALAAIDPAYLRETDRISWELPGYFKTLPILRRRVRAYIDSRVKT